VHDLVTKQRNDESRCGDYQYSGPARHITVDSIEELGANNDVDGGPTNTGENVEEGD
jgi:hypothetical protein